LESNSKGLIFIGGAQGQLVVRNGIDNWKLLANFDSQINAILPHPRYNLLVGTEDGSLFAVATTGEVHSLLSTMSSITTLVSYRDTVLIGTPNGLVSLNEDTSLTYKHLENYRINSIIIHDQTIIVATNRGVARYEAGIESDLSWIVQGVDSLELMYDSQDQLWIGTTKEGVYIQDAVGKLTNVNTSSGLANNRVLALFEDKDFNVWVGTNGGVARFRKVPFSTISVNQGLSSKFVRATYQSKNSEIWIATSEGLDLVNYSARKVNASFLPDQYVLSLAEDMNGNILAGTYTDGVFIKNGEKFIPFHNVDNGLPSNEVRAITVDLNNTLWIGTADGLVKANKDNAMRDFKHRSHVQVARVYF
jgi:ligand-binding sensor domain-containing protein